MTANKLGRRDFLTYAGTVGLFGCSSRSESSPLVIVTTDFAVPHLDPDDYYDVACSISLGVSGFVLDHPTSEAVAAIESVGGRVFEPSAIRRADAVAIIGAATNAARFHQRGQRVVLFAGDSQGFAEHNQLLDESAYEYIRPRSRWVPCFSGGLWQTDSTASFVQTTDDILLEGVRARCWFENHLSDALGIRNLWVGPLLRFAWSDRWLDHSVASGRFVAGANLKRDMVSGTRDLIGSAKPTCENP